MKNFPSQRRWWQILLPLAILLMSVSNGIPQTKSIPNTSSTQNTEGDEERRARPREFAEQIAKRIATQRPKATKRPLTTIHKPRYRALDADDNLVALDGVDVGFTFLLLKESITTDDPAVIEPQQRIVVAKDGTETKQPTKVIAKRVASNTQFTKGDWLRLTIEAPTKGYIYILNREEYSDGTLSNPYLVFPRVKDTGKTNMVAPGKLLFLPNQDGYFEIQDFSESKKKTTENFYVLITATKLTELPYLETSAPREINLELFNSLAKGNNKFWRFEAESEAAEALTKIEKLASTESNGVLTESDPTPQTVYHIGKNSSQSIFFAIKAQIK